MTGALLTLASQSPRRRELLAQLGLALEVRPAHVDEAPLPGEVPDVYVRRLARDKARAVGGEAVLGADTVVALGRELLGKPADLEEARRMLRSLSGRDHEVTTGVCVRRAGREETIAVTSEVRLVALSQAQIEWYLATGEGADKAGGYAVQGLAGAFVEEVRGSISNVVGLPLAESLALLERLEFTLPWSAAA